MNPPRKRVFGYISAFGLYHGLAIFFKVRRSRKKGLISFLIPGLKWPVWIRRDSSDFIVFEEIFVDRIYETPHKITANTIIDAGANIGLGSLYFLREFKPEKLICIEPEAANFEMLKKNLEQYSEVSLIKKALWSDNTILRFKNPNAASWAFEVEKGEGGGTDIQTVTLNELMSENELTRVDLLKIDIEGAEKDLFEKNTGWIANVGTAIVEFHEGTHPGVGQSISSLLASSGFSSEARGNSNFFYN